MSRDRYNRLFPASSDIHHNYRPNIIFVIVALLAAGVMVEERFNYGVSLLGILAALLFWASLLITVGDTVVEEFVTWEEDGELHAGLRHLQRNHWSGNAVFFATTIIWLAGLVLTWLAPFLLGPR